ncbi:hypothetical protein [Trinickia acidisoli]|uniref:hypothetical protein n=1 Tax=Trinickia acidisoli TaxID=2767482 RepID=UPI001A8C1B60|nr:hypothetical protein [Trinickia acidisoli]
MRTQNIVLTILSNKPVDGLVENHARYAHQWQYRHAVVDATHVYGERQSVLHKYHLIYHHLVNSDDSLVLLVLDQFAVVYGAQDLDAVIEGYEMLVTTQEPGSDLPAPSAMIFRNSASMRERLRSLIYHIARWAYNLPDVPEGPESLLLKEWFKPVGCTEYLRNGYLPSVPAVWATGSAIGVMARAQPFVAHGAPRWTMSNGCWHPKLDYDFRYVQVLIDESTALANGAVPPSQLLHRPADNEAPELHLNSDAPIAFVSLFTPNVAGYGKIHEDNFSRYCLRHGYGYHLYRDNPTFLPDGVTANWVKMHLIRRHLLEHEFVFWVDADILAINQQIEIERVIGQRDFMIGTDHTAWTINSCMIGVRNVSAMHAVVEQLCERIEQVSDRSTVYASGGDQLAIQEGLQALNMLNAAYVVDAMTLATSPVYATRNSHLVHFPAQMEHYRAATMAIWERWSLANVADKTM